MNNKAADLNCMNAHLLFIGSKISFAPNDMSIILYKTKTNKTICASTDDLDQAEYPPIRAFSMQSLSS